MSEILRVEHLSKVFQGKDKGDFFAADDVSFTLKAGEKLAIIGESGSGKTTVARLVTRLLETSSGRIYLDGEDITHAKGTKLKEAYQKMQMVFQSPIESFDPRLTLGDGIIESLLNHGLKEEAALAECQKLLSLCGLSKEFSHRYPHEVSGGQCQRAAIARALAIEPRLLILDEATSALDVTVQADILELLQHIQEKHNMAYLFICHDIALVQDFCDRVIVMHKGRIVETGTPDEVIRSPKEAYTKKLIDSVL